MLRHGFNETNGCLKLDQVSPFSWNAIHPSASPFQFQMRTGTYWRIMDSLVVDKSQELQKRMMNTEREEKKHLSW